ncbi:MAG: DUF3089 domain-containing protein [Ruminococcaceae bacterium]|nr:DUF3089 domain-containing protein [Oscillospiraceae bacterium]
MKTKRFLSLLIAVVLCLSSFTALAADDLAEEIFVVSAPEDEYVDYSNMFYWSRWNLGEEKEADLFFVCPTVDMGKEGNFNSDITDEKYRQSFDGAINMELGIYEDVARIYAPYYRQATFPVYSLSEEEQEKYLSIAYEDVKQAFLFYADQTDASRPLILAGFSQGADLIIRLMKDLFDEPQYQRRLVAAYAIGWKLTEDEVAEYPHLKPAKGETDTGVIVAFNSEDKDITSSLIIGEDEKTYSINPLNWKTTSEVADKTLNQGACFTDYSGNIKEEIPNLTGAYIDEERGALKVTDVKPEDYPGKLFDDGIYHLYDYQFFFRNLQENVAKRLSAYNEKYAERIDVCYQNKIVNFDVEPVIENDRTLVPLRAIFETMGCAVYYSTDDGKQIVSANRANDHLQLTIGENKMYFNGKEIALDVPAKIKDGRTLVPLRAISEAFECEVHWYGDTKTIHIDPPMNAYDVSAKKIEETITDEEGNVLIEAVAYYPVIKNPNDIPYLDNINADYLWDAERFIEEARAKKEDALTLKEQMGEDFKPFVYELTYEQPYRIWGYLSFINHKYVNIGGAHPSKIMDSRTYHVGSDAEMSVSEVIEESMLDASLSDYVTNLFVEKLKEIAPESSDVYTCDYVKEYLGYVQFYLTKNSLVLYFNQGEIAPYALGVISVEIPYAPQLFHTDMRHNYEAEHVFEYEYEKGYEWRVFAYSEDKLMVTEENTDYPPEEVPSEYYPVGLSKVTVKGKDKGNGTLILAHVTKGEGIETATQIYLSNFYIDDDHMLTLVAEEEAMYFIEK